MSNQRQTGQYATLKVVICFLPVAILVLLIPPVSYFSPIGKQVEVSYPFLEQYYFIRSRKDLQGIVLTDKHRLDGFSWSYMTHLFVHSSYEDLTYALVLLLVYLISISSYNSIYELYCLFFVGGVISASPAFECAFPEYFPLSPFHLTCPGLKATLNAALYSTGNSKAKDIRSYYHFKSNLLERNWFSWVINTDPARYVVDKIVTSTGQINGHYGIVGALNALMGARFVLLLMTLISDFQALVQPKFERSFFNWLVDLISFVFNLFCWLLLLLDLQQEYACVFGQMSCPEDNKQHWSSWLIPSKHLNHTVALQGFCFGILFQLFIIMTARNKSR